MPALVAARYRLGEPVGRGGMGRVWRAHDQILDRVVAVKEIVPPPALADPEAVHRRTLREARATARLSHPGVVRVFDVLEVDGGTWIVMEYVPSRSLQEAIAADGPLPPRRVAKIGLDLLAALVAAARAGVEHRDVKPANVLLADDGRVMLTDFGIAAIADDPSISTSDALIGSPEYMPPERAQSKHLGLVSDLWSLGATLYTAVEGRSPFRRATVAATLTAITLSPPEPPAHAGPLAPLLEALLQKDPADRPSAKDAAKMLRSAASGAYGRASIPPPDVRDGTAAAESPAVSDPSTPGDQRVDPGRPPAGGQSSEPARPEPGGTPSPAPAPSAAVVPSAVVPSAVVPSAVVPSAAAAPPAAPPESAVDDVSQVTPDSAVGGPPALVGGPPALVGGPPALVGGPPALESDAAPVGAPAVEPDVASAEAPEVGRDAASVVAPPVGSDVASAEAPAVGSDVASAEAPEVGRDAASVVASPAEPGVAAAETPAVDPDVALVRAPAEEPGAASDGAPAEKLGAAPAGASAAVADAAPAGVPAAVADAAAGQVPALAPEFAPGRAPAAEPDSSPGRVPGVEPDFVPGPTPAAAPDADRHETAPRSALSTSRRKWAVAAATALVVLLVAGAAIWFVDHRSSNGSARSAPSQPAVTVPSAPSAGPSSSLPAGSGVSGSPSASSSPSPSSSASSSGSGRPALPAGWHDYSDKTGFSVYVPDGWSRSRKGSMVYFRGDGRVLGIDQSSDPKSDPLADWREKSAYRVSQGEFPGYHLIRLVSVDYLYKSADWEYTFNGSSSRQHVDNRNILASSRQAYAIYWQTSDASWAAHKDDLALIYASFRPK